jgi:cytochrome oxidase Cu insertion factor (SCO1/SenC/PrrC family)
VKKHFILFSILLALTCLALGFCLGAYKESQENKEINNSILRMDSTAFDKEVTNDCTIYTSKDGTVKILFFTEHPNLVVE